MHGKFVFRWNQMLPIPGCCAVKGVEMSCKFFKRDRLRLWWFSLCWKMSNSISFPEDTKRTILCFSRDHKISYVECVAQNHQKILDFCESQPFFAESYRPDKCLTMSGLWSILLFNKMKGLCMICRNEIDCLKKFNVKRHYNSRHSVKYEGHFKSLRVEKAHQLKKSLQGATENDIPLQKRHAAWTTLSFSFSEAIA